MKKYIFTLLMSIFILPCFAQKDAQARKILDQTSNTFAQAGGIKASFSIKVGSKQTKGTLQLKDNKFVLTTNDVITWFDGKTQWSYLRHSDEVNMSNPSAEELQSSNPYTLINIYKKGFNYKYASIVGNNFKIILTPESRKQAITRIELLISKSTNLPQRITLEQQHNKSEINITSFQKKQNFSKENFQFNKKNYPGAEVIDLR